MRKLGWEIETLAIRSEVRASGIFTAEEREERAACFYILGGGLSKILAAHLATLLRHPAGYLRGLAHAIGYGGGSPRATLRWLFYFAEAVIAGRRVESLGIAHLHTHYASNVAWLVGAIFPIGVSMSIHGLGNLTIHADFGSRIKLRRPNLLRHQLLRPQPVDARVPHQQWRVAWRSAAWVCASRNQPRSPAPAGRALPSAVRRRNGCAALVPSADPRVAATGNASINLIMVGDGPDRPLLEKLAAEFGVGAA